MYKKVIECLKEYGYYFYEYDEVFFREQGFSIHHIIGVENGGDGNYYLEFDGEGDIVIWNISGKVVNIIGKKEHYKMIFELGRVIENIL